MIIKYQIYKGKDGKYYWRAVARNGRIVADGSEGYSTKRNAIRARQAFRHAVTQEGTLQ